MSMLLSRAFLCRVLEDPISAGRFGEGDALVRNFEAALFLPDMIE